MTRGMTLLETMLAVAMTGMVGAGISGMMHVLSNDVAMQHEVRTGIVRAALVQARLSAYVGRSRCLLDLEPDRVVLWLQDADGDDTVAAPEVRWISCSQEGAAAHVHWIKPAAGVSMPTYDTPETVDWWSQLDVLQRRADVTAARLGLAGDLQSLVFLDTLEASGIDRRRDAQQRRRIEVDLLMRLGQDGRAHRVGESIRLHRPPAGENAP